MRSSGEAVGHVRRVLNKNAYVNGRQISGGDPLPAGTLSTDAGGVVDFGMAQKFVDCQMRANSSMDLSPASSALFRLRQGRLLCRTDDSPSSLLFRAGEQLLRVSDPVFILSATANGVTVTVEHGFVELDQRGSDSWLLVGPNSKAVVASDGATIKDPVPSTKADIGDAQPTISRMLGALRDPQFALPSTSSPALDRIRTEQVIRIGIEETARLEKTEFLQTFAGAFLKDLLGDRWGKATLRFETVQLPKAAALLGTEYDMILSPRPLARHLPFFLNPEKELWHLLVSESDEPFELALRQFLRESLFYGQYGEIYLQSFKVLPDYDRIRELIGP